MAVMTVGLPCDKSLYVGERASLLAEIAVANGNPRTERSIEGVAGQIRPRTLARGLGWTVDEVVCTCGPGDRSYDEEHQHVAIAIVTAGTFQYRGSGANG